jgi:hypothetical protein
MKFEIYQVNEENRRSFAFEGLDFLKSVKESVVLDRYAKVYEGDRVIKKSSRTAREEVADLLNELFEEFNTNRPADFKSRSVSVSDMIKIKEKYYFCDSFGWKIVKPV